MKIELMDVLQFIFEQFHEEEYFPIDKAKDMQKELEQIGFHPQDIDSAFCWLDGLAETCSPEFIPAASATQSIRHYHPHEAFYIPTECQGFLSFLEQIGVIEAHTREAVIDRVLALELDEPIDLEQLKWVVMVVLFNTPGNHAAAIWLENMDACFH